MSDACINKSLPAYKMLKTRYGEFIADALVTYVTKEKGMDPKKGFYIPTTGESRDFLKKFNDNKLQSIRRGLKANPYLTTEGIADYLQGIIRKADGAYFIVKGFEYGPISKAAAVKEIFEPHLQLMETIAKEYPDIFKLVPTKQKQTIVVQITPRTQPARQVPVQQTLFQQEAAEGTPIDRLNQILKTKLAEAGIKVEFVDSLSSIYRQDIAGLYDVVKKLVQIANNKAGRDTLPEEAAHALIEALDLSNPLLTKLMNDVVYTTVYEQVKQEYADLYGTNEELYRKEALGKLVAQAWINKYEDNPSLLRTITLLIDKVLSLFKKVDIEGMQKQINSDVIELADILLNKPIITLTQTIKPGVPELFESNPELANAVYEALGFESKISDVKYNRTFQNEEYHNAFVKGGLDAVKKVIEENKQKELSAAKQLSREVDLLLEFEELNNKTNKTNRENDRVIELYVILKNSKELDFEYSLKEIGLPNTYVKPISKVTPQQKQQAQQLYSQYLDSKVKEIDNSLYISVLNQLEQENIIEKDCSGGGKLKAEKGLKTNFTKGSQWEIVQDLKGYPSHSQGGVDIKIGKNGFSFTRDNGVIEAKYGLVLPKIK